MINYYKFNLAQPDFNKLICQANNELWKFQLTNVIQDRINNSKIVIASKNNDK